MCVNEKVDENTSVQGGVNESLEVEGQNYKHQLCVSQSLNLMSSGLRPSKCSTETSACFTLFVESFYTNNLNPVNAVSGTFSVSSTNR